MTVTISRLYDTYAAAQQAVTGLEAAGVPHSEISIVANNSDNWYGGKKIVTATGSMTVLKPLVPEQVSVQVSVAQPGCWRASVF